MIRNAQRVEDMMDRQVVTQNGHNYAYNSVSGKWDRMPEDLPTDPPMPGPMRVFTLDGVIDYIRENVEGLIPDGEGERLLLQVEDEAHVRLYGALTPMRRERRDILSCRANAPQIAFGQYMDSEQFCTTLLSDFIATPARDELFRVVKSITNQQSMNTADDGVSQIVTVQQGVSLATNVKFENPVPLAPMRTFCEVEQPESNFTLRVNEKGMSALFEADGGAWRAEAVRRVRDYLRANLQGCHVTVIA